MGRYILLLVVLSSLCSRIQAEGYQVPGTSVLIPQLDGAEASIGALGLMWKEPPAPAIMIQVVRNLGRKSMWNKEAMGTLSINGTDCEIRHGETEMHGRKYGTVVATAQMGEQVLNVNGYFEAENPERRDAVLKVLKGITFGNQLTTRCQEALPIDFAIIPAMDYVLIYGTTVILADKNASLANAKGMTVQAFRIQGGGKATESELMATCQQMAQKVFGLQPEQGRLEKAKIGKLQGFRLVAGDPVPGGRHAPAMYALSWDDLYVLLFPSPKSEAAELELFYQQLEKMNETVSVR